MRDKHRGEGNGPGGANRMAEVPRPMLGCKQNLKFPAKSGPCGPKAGPHTREALEDFMNQNVLLAAICGTKAAVARGGRAGVRVGPTLRMCGRARLPGTPLC